MKKMIKKLNRRHMFDIKRKSIVTYFNNRNGAAKDLLYPESLKKVLNISDVAATVQDIQMLPNYTVTPLHEITDMAKKIYVSKVWYKDESSRFGLGSFKALGAAYGVARQLIIDIQNNHGIDLTMHDILSGKFKDKISQITVSCATDGNYGRSVAWAAQLFGCQCVIYIHQHVSNGREEAIAHWGAQVIRIDGNYDDSVRHASDDAKRYNRYIVSDTSYPGNMEIPKYVTLGYTVMFYEILAQLKNEIPTHIIVQGGVGGLASAACAYFWEELKEKRPRLIVVEPESANCLQESAKHNKPTTVSGDLNTLMAGLACGEVSHLAWDVLSIGADDFVTLNEDSIVPTMRLLADYGIEAGESAVPGVSTLIKAAETNQLGLKKNSRVLLIGTEGATDPYLYDQLIGIKRDETKQDETKQDETL